MNVCIAWLFWSETWVSRSLRLRETLMYSVVVIVYVYLVRLEESRETPWFRWGLSLADLRLIDGFDSLRENTTFRSLAGSANHSWFLLAGHGLNSVGDQ